MNNYTYFDPNYPKQAQKLQVESKSYWIYCRVTGIYNGKNVKYSTNSKI